jgi:predicted ATPase
MGQSFLITGDVVQGRIQYDQAIALYDPAEHRPLATRFGQDVGVAALCYRSVGLWLLGYPGAARVDIERAVKDAREIGHAATLMYALSHAQLPYIFCGNYVTASALGDELVALANEKNAPIWKGFGTLNQGLLFALSGKATDAVQITGSGLSAWRSTGSTLWMPLYLPQLALAHAELGRSDDAMQCIGEAMTAVETTKERWSEAEANRIAGEVTLKLPKRDARKAEEYFERALVVARAQQTKSWELRSATSLARLWHSQGKVQEARELLAPVYGWFTEGFDTRDLKEAKALLGALAQ